MLFANLGFKDLWMNNLKLNFIVYEQIYIVIINYWYKLVQEQDLRDVTLKVVYG